MIQIIYKPKDNKILNLDKNNFMKNNWKKQKMQKLWLTKKNKN